MAHAFLSDAWFAEVDKLVAAAGDLKIPDAMKTARVNINVTSPSGTTPIHLVDGLFHPGHQSGADATLTLTDALARKIFLEADAAAGVQAFLAGEMTVEGDLAKVVALQTVEPSVQQQQLTKQIAAITE